MSRNKSLKNEVYDKAFPHRLRELMKQTGKTQKEVGQAIEKTRQAVGYYADGSSSPDWETLVALAQYFNVSTDWLLGISDAKSTDNDILSACQITGLSEEAIQNLTEIKRQYPDYIDSLNFLLQSTNFENALYAIYAYKDSIRYLNGLRNIRKEQVGQLQQVEDYKPNTFLLEEIHKATEKMELSEYRLSTQFSYIVQEISRITNEE